MRKNVVVLFVAMVVFMFAQLSRAMAQEGSNQEGKIVDCTGLNGACKLFEGDELSILNDFLDNESVNFHSALLSYGTKGQWKAGTTRMQVGLWDAEDYDDDSLWSPVSRTIPRMIIIDKDSHVSFPEMGMYWRKDKLQYSEPGIIFKYEDDGRYEYLVTKPYPLRILSEKQLSGNISQEPAWDIYFFHDDDTYWTYSWNGSRMYHWRILPSVEKDKIVIYILELHVTDLVSHHIPPRIDVVYQDISELNWVSGDKVYFQDTFENTLQSTRRESWGTHWSWNEIRTEGLVLSKDGETFLFESWYVHISGSCRKDETFFINCHGYDLYKKEQLLYVEAIRDHGDGEPYLSLIDVPPTGPLKEVHMDFIEASMENGQIITYEGTVTGNHEIFYDVDVKGGKTEIFGLEWIVGSSGSGSWLLGGVNGKAINIDAYYMPVLGTKVRVYVHTDNVDIRNVSNTEKVELPDVIAIQDAKTGNFWYYNLKYSDNPVYAQRFRPEEYWGVAD